MTQDDNKLSRRQLLNLGTAVSGAALIGTTLASRGVFAGQDALPKVPRRVLGKTKKEVPILLFGSAMNLDPRFDPKLAEAFRMGIDYVDTADCYGGGRSESSVGSFHKVAKNRDALWITSKSDRWDPPGFEATVKESLTKLATDHIDLYFLHQLDDPAALNDDLFKVVERLKKEKKIVHFGFSCHSGNVVELLNKASTLSIIDAIMFRYNFRQYGNKELGTAIDACAKANIGLIAMKTQSSEAGISDAWKKYEKTGKWNKYQAVLKAVWADERIAAAVSHMDNLDKLRENVAAALDKTKLSEAEVEALEKYAQETRALTCDGCDHFCNPAIEAPVRIGDTMRALMYHEAYGDAEKARNTFLKLPDAARQLSKIDFSPANRACPHGVDVVAHMARAAKIFNA